MQFKAQLGQFVTLALTQNTYNLSDNNKYVIDQQESNSSCMWVSEFVLNSCRIHFNPSEELHEMLALLFGFL